MNMQTFDNIGGLAGIALAVIGFLWMIMMIVLPFVVYSIRSELLKQSEIMRQMRDTLQGIRHNTKP